MLSNVLLSATVWAETDAAIEAAANIKTNFFIVFSELINICKIYNVNVLISVQSNKKIMKQPNFLEEKSAQHPILWAKATTKKEIKNNVYVFFDLIIQ